MDRLLYFKYGRSSEPNHINHEQVRDELPLGLTKTITHNVHLIPSLFGLGLRAASGVCAGIYWMFYRLQGGKEEAFALYGAAFMFSSSRTTFLLLAILSPINPERASRERLRGSMVTGNEQQAAGCCAGIWGCSASEC